VRLRCRARRTNLHTWLLSEIVKVEAHRLAILIVSDDQIGDRLSFDGGDFGVAWLFTLGFALSLFGALFLSSPFLLAFGKSAT
jgi:hypothetical protein